MEPLIQDELLNINAAVTASAASLVEDEVFVRTYEP